MGAVPSETLRKRSPADTSCGGLEKDPHVKRWYLNMHQLANETKRNKNNKKTSFSWLAENMSALIGVLFQICGDSRRHIWPGLWSLVSDDSSPGWSLPPLSCCAKVWTKSPKLSESSTSPSPQGSILWVRLSWQEEEPVVLEMHIYHIKGAWPHLSTHAALLWCS